MIKKYSKKIVIAGLMVALGIILPFVTAHGFGITGNVLLPMHIPVLLCGFFCGPLFGALCGLILPLLSSVLTGMPILYPMALLMTCELAAYGFISGLVYKLAGYSKKIIYIYVALIGAMTAGRIAYGLSSWILLFLDADAGKFSVITSVITGIPGIIIQLILVPGIVAYIRKSSATDYDAAQEAIRMIEDRSATCVIVKNNKIISAESPQGIAYIIDLYEKGMLKDVFVADTIIGKAAAMILALGGVKACYGHTVSEGAIKWMGQKNIPISYNTSTPIIQNRKSDGMCPMESTVQDIYSETEALEALKNKVAQLRSLQSGTSQNHLKHP